jgi:hypothetical protein
MEKNSVNILGATATTFTIPTATLATAGTYDVLISGPSGYTLLDTICSILTINPKPTVLPLLKLFVVVQQQMWY